jgi:MarR family transcriptional regulator, organic hydroperoxide resistance regulator
MPATATDQLVEDLLSLWRVLRQSTHPVRRCDITPEQFWLLRHLRQHGPRSIGELAEALGVTQSSATTACQRLEKSGLATRARDPLDERVVRVTLTEVGQQRIEQWRRVTREKLAELLTPLSPPERDELQRLLRKTLAEVEVATGPARGAVT